MAQRPEADGEAGIGDAGAVTQASRGVRQADLGQRTVRRTAFELREDAREVKHAHPGIACEQRERERLGVARLDQRLRAIDAGRIPGEALGPEEWLS